MADQIDVAHRLDAHHADQRVILFDTPEGDPGSDLGIELAGRHVRLMPAFGGNDATIGLRRSIDDRENGDTLVDATEADVAHRPDLRIDARPDPTLRRDRASTTVS